MNCNAPNVSLSDHKARALYRGVKKLDALYFKLRKAGENGGYLMGIVQTRQKLFNAFIERTGLDEWPG